MAQQHLSVDAMIEDARARTAIDAFDSDSFLEPLNILIDDLNASIDRGERSEQGVERFRVDIVAALAKRLKVAEHLRQHPDLLDAPIERPVFVMGIPRTGTTLLSNLLAADPARRSPLTWEIDDPVPPATSDTLTTDPRALARLEQERAMLAAMPEMGKYYRGSAIYPNEDAFIMGDDFKSLMLESRGKLPAYREYIFSQEIDFTSAYQYHKKFLQVLQSKAPGTWNCKLPSHALSLETLFATYPDARVIWTHRDPYTAAGSLTNLISLAHMGYMGRVDKDWLAWNYPWQAAEHANRIMDFLDTRGEDKIIHVQYADLTRQPIETMRALYKQLGDDFTEEAQAGMQAWLDDNPQDKFGRHEYKLAQYGLSVEQIAPMFERYLSRYDVEREG
jgi:hypothetical protein